MVEGDASVPIRSSEAHFSPGVFFHKITSTLVDMIDDLDNEGSMLENRGSREKVKAVAGLNG